MRSPVYYGDAIEVLRQLDGRHLHGIGTEDALQRVIYDYLGGPPHELPAEREIRLGPKERIDVGIRCECPRLGTPQIIAIEAKLDASVTPVFRQLQRYAAHADVVALVLVTTSQRLAVGLAVREIGGKPLYVVRVRRF